MNLSLLKNIAVESCGFDGSWLGDQNLDVEI